MSMRRRFHGLATAVLGTAFLGAGCGKTAPPATFDQFIDEYEKAICRVAVRCGAAGSEASCQAATNPRADMLLSFVQVAEGVKAGRMKYSPAGAASVLS